MFILFFIFIIFLVISSIQYFYLINKFNEKSHVEWILKVWQREIRRGFEERYYVGRYGYNNKRETARIAYNPFVNNID